MITSIVQGILFSAIIVFVYLKLATRARNNPARPNGKPFEIMVFAGMELGKKGIAAAGSSAG